jgi:4-hydroxy-3-polyprenylbenzoate decarboxylase
LRIILGVSGASGVSLAEKFLQYLPKEIEKYIIITDHAKVVFAQEENRYFLDNDDISEATASGSFKCDAMIVLPCSMNTLAKISTGIADNLLTRTASVMIKERRKLILAPRELPYSTIAIENMLRLSQNGVIIAPPVLGYYADSATLEDMERFLIGKWYDLIGIEHNLFKRWKSE